MSPPELAPPHARRVLVRQFLRYVVVGGIAFVCDYATLIVITQVFGTPYIGATVGFLLGLVVNYLLSVGWVFDYHALSNRQTEFVIYALVGIAGLALTLGLLWLLTGLLGLDYQLSKLAAAALVLVFNFSSRRYLLFLRR